MGCCSLSLDRIPILAVATLALAISRPSSARAGGEADGALAVPIILPVIASNALGDEPRFELLGKPSARGIVVCRITVPGGWSGGALSMQVRAPGGETRPGLTRAAWSSGALGTLAGGAEEKSVLIPLVGVQMWRTQEFVFPVEGQYRLTLSPRGEESKDAEPTSISVVIADARPSVVAFLDRIAKDEFFAKLAKAHGWSNPPKGMATRTLAVIDALLTATTAVEPLEGEFATAEGYRIWTDAMLDLSRDLSASGYAPYAAFFAGAGYVGLVCELPQYVDMEVEQRRRRPLVAQASDALEAALKGADNYLKPRVVCQQARLSACLGSWDDADRLLDEANSLAGSDAGAQQLIGQMRQYIARSHRNPG